MNTKQKELIKYIFDTEYKEIDKNTIAENKGLSALCLIYLQVQFLISFLK